MVLDGTTTSKNETLLASYTTKKDEKHYEIFKVNNQTAKVKNLSKLVGGEIHFFNFKGKGYVVHRDKRAITIYDESFKSVYKKATWKSGVRLYDFPIVKSKVDTNLIAISDNVKNFNLNKFESIDILLKLDSKGKLVEVPEKKLPGETYHLSFGSDKNGNNKQYAIREETLIHSGTNFNLKLDTSGIPNLRNGSRMSFSSHAITKYKNHFYLSLRENDRGEGADLLLKVNNKGKVVDYLELPNYVSASPEPAFMNNQVVFYTDTQEGSFYHTVDLDNFSIQTIAKDSHVYSHSVFNDNLYYLYLNGEFRFFNKRNEFLYALPKSVSPTENGRYGIHIENDYVSSTIYDLKTGATLATLKTGHIASFDDKLLAVEQKSGYKEVKLYKLK